jgi:hypothetical protein
MELATFAKYCSTLAMGASLDSELGQDESLSD